MLSVAKKSNDTYRAALKSLSKDPHYNFSILKELTQANPNVVEEGGDEVEGKEQTREEQQVEKPADDDQMLFFQVRFR